MNIISKFGGRASCSAQAIDNIIFLSKNTDRKVLVFSAIGKSPNLGQDSKITDLLFGLAKSVKNISKTRILLQKVISKYKYLSQCLNIKTNITKTINSYYKKFLQSKDISWFVSRGEYLTSKLYATSLNIKFVPAERVIFFKDNTIDYNKTLKRLTYYRNRYNRIVVPGFYGIDNFGKIKLFERGGGDTTGAIISKVLCVDLYENWTDTDGVKPINPNIMNTDTINKLSYQDLCVMTRYDTKVIHYTCADILKDSSTKLKVGNIYNIGGDYTIVAQDGFCQKYLVYKVLDDKVNVVTKKHNQNINSFILHNNNLKNRLINIFNNL